MIPACFVLVTAFVMDALSLRLLVAMPLVESVPVNAIGLHALASTLTAAALPGLLPAAYREMPRSGCVFFWMIAFFAPVLGMLGLVLGFVPALWRQRAPVRHDDWLRSNVNAGFDTAGLEDQARPEHGDRCLAGVLLCAPRHHSRVRALIATLSLDAQNAAPLLRIGLLDRDDDVRLLAYSLLTRKEKVIEDRIGKSLCQLDSEKPETVLAAHCGLAYAYWELALLGNTGGSSAFLLEQARTHAQASLALQPTQASLHLLLGRILLKARRLEEARAALLHAAVSGVALDKVAPFLAEVAFQRRHFGQISPLLKSSKSNDRVWRLRSVSAYWGEE